LRGMVGCCIAGSPKREPAPCREKIPERVKRIASELAWFDASVTRGV
jgi:hypothetical protein